MVSDLLDKLDGVEERAFHEKAIKECAATVYIGMWVFSVFKTLPTDLGPFPYHSRV
jgi:hypothetical protein